jgi:hypothetical protein
MNTVEIEQYVQDCVCVIKDIMDRLKSAPSNDRRRNRFADVLECILHDAFNIDKEVGIDNISLRDITSQTCCILVLSIRGSNIDKVLNVIGRVRMTLKYIV